jgi:hypothetical protein
MRRIESVQDFIAAIEARKRELGITEAMIEAARNNGQRRTTMKRELLRTMRERAVGQDLKPYVAHGVDESDR